MTSMTAVPWEQGSEYAWPGIPDPGIPGQVQSTRVPWDADGRLVFSGRDALRLVLGTGIARHGWRRLWVPEYFCQHVVAALCRPDLELLPYPDHPLLAEPRPPAAAPGDAVLVMNYFGLRDGFPRPPGPGVQIIEDHSHDPTSAWAHSSGADFCIASLRKTIPVGDGGVAWSPRGHELPSAPAIGSARREAAGLRLSAMLLKGMYLRGLPVGKDLYRELARRGEEGLARAEISEMSEVSRAVLSAFDLTGWRAVRGRNVEVLRAAVKDVPWLEVLAPVPRGEAVAFAGVLVVDDARRREALRHRLLEAQIYPAVLWPLETTVLPVGEPARDVSRRLLSIHCDGRYGPGDMERVAEVVRGVK